MDENLHVHIHVQIYFIYLYWTLLNLTNNKLIFSILQLKWKSIHTIQLAEMQSRPDRKSFDFEKNQSFFVLRALLFTCLIQLILLFLQQR